MKKNKVATTGSWVRNSKNVANKNTCLEIVKENIEVKYHCI
jgi:hypothetical protein